MGTGKNELYACAQQERIKMVCFSKESRNKNNSQYFNI